MRSIAILGCNIYNQITVVQVTLPKAVLNTVKIFAVWYQLISVSVYALWAQLVLVYMTSLCMTSGCMTSGCMTSGSMTCFCSK